MPLPRDAVWSEWSDEFVAWLRALGLRRGRHCRRPIAPPTSAEPPLGPRARPRAHSIAIRRSEPVRHRPIQVVLSDGLSARAAEAHFERSGLRCAIVSRSSARSARRSRCATVASPWPTASAPPSARRSWCTSSASGRGSAPTVSAAISRCTPARDDRRRSEVRLERTACGARPAEAGATIAGVCRRILERGSSGTDLRAPR